MNNYYILRDKLKGPIFSIITPFTKKQKIDYVSLKRYIIYLYTRGARVFYLMTYNSRLTLLTENEIIKINLFCIDLVKKIDEENVIICAEPYHCSTIQSIKFVKTFKKYGADIVSLIFGEKFYSEKQIYNHFSTIHEETSCFLLLHQQILENGISGNPPFIYYPLKTLKKISKLSRFIAMKEDAKNKQYTKKICQQVSKDMIIITSGGGKRQWLEASKFGCTSWLSGISNLDPKIAFDFYEYYKKNDSKRMKFIIEKIEDPFFKIKDKYGWHLTIKAFLELNKNFSRYERSPLKEISKEDFMICKKAFKKIRNIGNYFE